MLKTFKTFKVERSIFFERQFKPFFKLLNFGNMGTIQNFTDSILNVDATFFKKYDDVKNPIHGNLLRILTSQILAAENAQLIADIRATTDKKKRTALKIELPCFIPSGTFSHRSEAGLIAHNGFITFDLDAGVNTFLNASTAERVKVEISKLNVVAYCGLSASGTGLWGLIPIAYPDRHKEHFEALSLEFLENGYIIDKSCSDICRLRFWSLDTAPYINHHAKLYKGLPKPKPAPRYAPTRSTALPDDLPARAAEYLIKNRVPLECTRNFYMKIAWACKDHWGNDGEGIALDILNACTTFAASNTASDKKWTQLWKSGGRKGGRKIGIGTLVDIAKDAGFKYTLQPAPAPIDTKPQPAPNLPPPGTWERFEGQINEPFEQIMTADDYPAIWDEPGPAAEAIKKCIRPIQHTNQDS